MKLGPRSIVGYNGTPEERFWRKVNKTETCWLWTGSHDNDGYGNFGLNGGSVLAHKFSYESVFGPVPDGLELDHLCRNPPCVRPDHLEPVTHKENMKRGKWPRNKATHCPKGHPYSGDNLRVTPNGFNLCKECNRQRSRDFQANLTPLERQQLSADNHRRYIARKAKLT